MSYGVVPLGKAAELLRTLEPNELDEFVDCLRFELTGDPGDGITTIPPSIAAYGLSQSPIYATPLTCGRVALYRKLAPEEIAEINRERDTPLPAETFAVHDLLDPLADPSAQEL
jgi:hypothetical protein